MDAIVEDLISIVTREISAFEELLKTLKDKQRAIVEGQTERLNKYVEDESKLAAETQSIENERVAKTQELAEKLALDELNPRLSKIIEQVEEKYAERLREQRTLLKALVGRIQTLNRSNQYLLNYSLKFIEKSMKILLGGTDKTDIYQRDGRLQKQTVRQKVLDRAV
ncbi:MAG: flagellar protein FlgN [bacterium]